MLYEEYDKHLFAVDCVIFGYDNKELKLLLYPRGFEPSKGKWSLMGGFVSINETVEAAAMRLLFQITGLKDIYLEQVNVFSDPQRESAARVISVGFYALIRIDQHSEDSVREFGAHWWPVNKIPDLVFDHQQIVNKALQKLQFKASNELTGRELLPEKFSIPQLKYLYEAIFQQEFEPANFRKKVLAAGNLLQLDIKDTSESKKGAYYYKFKDNAVETKEVGVINLNKFKLRNKD